MSAWTCRASGKSVHFQPFLASREPSFLQLAGDALAGPQEHFVWRLTIECRVRDFNERLDPFPVQPAEELVHLTVEVLKLPTQPLVRQPSSGVPGTFPV